MKNNRLVGIFFIELYSIISLASAAIITVPSDYGTIQDGIDAAQNGDTVLIADGTYSGSRNINLDLAGKAILLRSEHGAATCIINCEYNGRGLYLRHDETPETVIDGLTIKQGGITSYGGGIYLEYSSPRIRNCVVTSCYAVAHGGGVECHNSASPIIENCAITANTCSKVGGGIGTGLNCNPIIYNATITSNTANYGGGIAIDRNSKPVFFNSTISMNSAISGGAVYSLESSRGTILNCLITQNQADYRGAGVFIATNGCTMLSNCTFAGNVSSIVGGAIYGDEFGGIGSIMSSILWGDAPEEVAQVGISQIAITFSDVQNGYPGQGNIDSAPLFVAGPQGAYYLSQQAAGQPENSPCIDAGELLATEVCFTEPTFTSCLHEYTTRTDGIGDEGSVDMGFHYPLFDSTPTPVPTQAMTLTPSPSCTGTPCPSNTPSSTPSETQIPLTPTPTVPALGVELLMPETFFVSGDLCWLKASIANPGPEVIHRTRLFVVLDLEIGYYWFYPSWSQYPPDTDYVLLIEVGVGVSESMIIPEFEWPAGVGSYFPAHFYAALVTPDTTSVMGSIGTWTFGYGE